MQSLVKPCKFASLETGWPQVWIVIAYVPLSDCIIVSWFSSSFTSENTSCLGRRHRQLVLENEQRLQAWLDVQKWAAKNFKLEPCWMRSANVSTEPGQTKSGPRADYKTFLNVWGAGICIGITIVEMPSQNDGIDFGGKMHEYNGIV